jgi:membrane protease YdiL (CAAX protease family)
METTPDWIRSGTGANRDRRRRQMTRLQGLRWQAAEEDRRLSGHLLPAIVASAVPVPLTIAPGVGYGLVTGVSAAEIGTAANNLAYGVASLSVLVALYAFLATDQWRTAVPFERPGRSECLWTAAFFIMGVVVFPVATVLAEMAGAPTLDGLAYTPADTRTLLAVVFGGVLVAPLVEEVLFRGYLLETLLQRGSRRCWLAAAPSSSSP